MSDTEHILVPLNTSAAAFTGHRTYNGEGDAALRSVIAELYDRGVHTFLSGMAVGFDLAAAEMVLVCRAAMPGLRLVAVVPFAGQQARFSTRDRDRYCCIAEAADELITLSPTYHRACYAVRNDFLVANASCLVAWYDGSPGGTHYTVQRAQRHGREIIQLCSALPPTAIPEPTLF